MVKKILITGSTGMLGAELVRLFQATPGFETYGLSSSVNPALGEKQLRVDLSQRFDLHKLMDAPDIIIHTAALTDLGFCEREPQIAKRVNTEASGILAGFTDKKTLFIYISTDSVFDGLRGDYSENDSPNPLNVYAKTKLDGEEAVMKACKGKALIVRTNIYGIHHPMKNSLCEWAYKSWSNGETISGFTDTIFNAVYTGQLAQILQQMIERDIPQSIINVGSENALSKYEFLEKFRTKLNMPENRLKAALSTDFKSSLPRPKDTSLNTELLSTLTMVPNYSDGLTAWIDNVERQQLSHSSTLR